MSISKASAYDLTGLEYNLNFIAAIMRNLLVKPQGL